MTTSYFVVAYGLFALAILLAFFLGRASVNHKGEPK